MKHDLYPLYPELTEEGKAEAQLLMENFKPVILLVIEDLMRDLYCDVSMHIESDHWSNYRNQLLDGFRGYDTRQHSLDFKELRQAIYAKNKAEIVKDLNQDLVEENERLKKFIEDRRR